VGSVIGVDRDDLTVDAVLPAVRRQRVVRYTDFAADSVRTLCPTAPELRAHWADPAKRSEIIHRLEERGINFAELADVTKQPEADPFDLLWIREPFLSFEGDLPQIVVHGHTPAAEPSVRPHRIGIDTGACFGGVLTCLVLEGQRLRFLEA